jgi:hypothetical protein
MAKHSENSRPDGTQQSEHAAEYDVGYRRPPRHTRFKPGHPGCGGRPKRQRNLRTVLEATLDERITIREGKRPRKMTKRDAIILRLVNDAVSGNPKALPNLIALMRSHGLIGQPQEGTDLQPLLFWTKKRMAGMTAEEIEVVRKAQELAIDRGAMD